MNDSCPQCAAPVGVGLIFCKNCGATLRPPVALTQSLAQGTSSVSQVRPWVRYWARMFDLSLFGLVAGLLIAIFDPRAFSVTKRFGGLGSQVIWQMILLFGWVFTESSILSFFGTTPGKALFRTRLVLGESQSIPYSMALSRSFKVWWRGLAAGFPFINLLTLTHAETDLNTDSITSWDREGGFIVTHEKIGVLRVVIAAICLGLCFALAAIGTFAAVGQ